MLGRINDRRLVTYGFSPQADVRAVEIEAGPEGTGFDAVLSDRMPGGVRTIAKLHLPMPGRHNLQNSLAAVAVAAEMGLDDDRLRRALAGFAGVKRRFTKTGEVAGVTIIDDYGHHPVEIAAVLETARLVTEGRVVAVVQPHRYTRLDGLFEEFCTCFNDADTVIVADVHAAGEAPIEGVDRDALVEGLRGHGHRHVVALDGPAALAPMIASETEAGDIVICLGAGSISGWANALPAELAAILEPGSAEAGA